MYIRFYFSKIIALFLVLICSTNVDAQYMMAIADQTANPYFKIIQTLSEETFKPRKNEVELKVESPKVEEEAPKPTFATETPTPTPKVPKPYIRKTKRIAADYESYAVVLKNSDRPLLSTDLIFKQFGSVLYDKTEEGKYVYMICTPFKSKKSVEDFLEIVLQPRFPEAHIVAYDKGEMKK
jgi:hypothetical protein